MESNNSTVCFPVLIPTLNRYDHFVRCVESLRKNKLAKNTELIIGLDYPPAEKYIEGNNRIKKYIQSIDGFGKVTVFERETNLGALPNIRSLVQYAYEKYSAIIITEDDNEFSPNFLDYMNQALTSFEDDDKITTVSGYNYPYLYKQKGYTSYLRPICSDFGLGMWRDKSEKNFVIDEEYFISTVLSTKKSAKILFSSISEMIMLIKMVKKGTMWSDVCRTIYNINECKYQLAPSISLVRNHGYDGSGEHCGKNESFAKQEIDHDTSFSFNGTNSSSTLRNWWCNLTCMLPKRRLLSVLAHFFFAIRSYISLRISLQKN